MSLTAAPTDPDTPAPAPEPALRSYPSPVVDLTSSYRRILARIVDADPATRRDILRDLYRELEEPSADWTPFEPRQKGETRCESSSKLR